MRVRMAAGCGGVRRLEDVVKLAQWFIVWVIAAAGCDIRNAIYDNTRAVREQTQACREIK